MSSIFSTQNRQTFLRRKYCFLVASALSPPVGRMEPLMGRPPRCSAMLFSYLLGNRSRGGSSRHGSARTRTARFGHTRHHMLKRHGWGGRRRRFPRGALFALFLALFDFLQFFVDADALEFHHQIRDAQAPFQFDHALRFGSELEQNIESLTALLDPIGQLADAP